jgi:hypothetical protein
VTKRNFEVGDEVRDSVTAVWPDGQVTIQIAGAGHKVTMRGDTGHIVATDGAPTSKPSGKPRRLV